MKLSTANMQRAVDRQQTWYLPKNHSINLLEEQEYNEVYQLEKYRGNQSQVRFCVTVLSHNNIQHRRFAKVMNSIVMQEYENYHIVFIDDNSTDDNMRATREWMRVYGFPEDRVTYVQNLQRNFATYNIINAAFNYCDENDVQMLIDGDDELIGRRAMQVMNSAYQEKETWVAYSNYKSNMFAFGRSENIQSRHDYAMNNLRVELSVFGAIRTFRVKLIYNIPPVYHKKKNGEWLDTVYDDAMSHPLFELSGPQRISYVPEILYQYNTQYGDNDDSTAWKKDYRFYTYQYIVNLPIVEELKNLNGTVRNSEIFEQLRKDYGVRYQVVE